MVIIPWSACRVNGIRITIHPGQKYPLPDVLTLLLLGPTLDVSFVKSISALEELKI